MRRLPDMGRRGSSVLLVGAFTVVALAAGSIPAAAGATAPTTPATASAAPSPAVATGAPPTAPPAPAAPLKLAPGVTSNSPPAPHVIGTFAGQLTGPRRALPLTKVLTVPVAPDVDGCDRNYGEPSQCVPKTLPRGQTDVCAYLAQHGIKGVRVKGADARALDPDHDGVVCD